MSIDKLKAVSILFKAGYEQDRAAVIADKLLKPENGKIVLDYNFFMEAPKGVGAALAQILPSSEAVELKLDCHNPVYGHVHTPIRVMRSNAGRDFGSKMDLGALFAGLNDTKLQSISMNDWEMGDDVFKSLSDAISKASHLKHIEIRHCDIADSLKNGAFAPDFSKSAIQSIALTSNDMDGESVVALFKKPAGNAKLFSVDLSENNVWNGAAGEFIPMMPKSVKKLNVAGQNLNNAIVAAQVAGALVKASQLTDLDMSSSAIDSAVCCDLFNVLPKTDIERLNIAGNLLEDDAAKQLVDVLSHKSCKVYQTGFTEKPKIEPKRVHWQVPENTAEPETLAALTEAEAKNERKYLVKVEQERCADLYEKMSAEEKVENPFIAAKAGRIGEFLDSKPLKADDFLQEDAEGKSLLTHIAEAKSLSQMFEPKRWTNPNEMQGLWNKVSEESRQQMDGKDGRPSFIKAKSIVMTAMIKNRITSGR